MVKILSKLVLTLNQAKHGLFLTRQISKNKAESKVSCRMSLCKFIPNISGKKMYSQLDKERVGIIFGIKNVSSMMEGNFTIIN